MRDRVMRSAKVRWWDSDVVLGHRSQEENDLQGAIPAEKYQ
jgi:hypothetical protein